MHGSTNKPLTTWSLAALALSLATAINCPARPPVRLDPDFDRSGNILISDQFNNRVVEVMPNGRIVWQYGNGSEDFSGASPVGVNDAERIHTSTLIACTGTPAGLIPEAPDGVADNRVILVDQFGNTLWQYGQFGQTGDGFNLLNVPVQATWLPTSHVLITDQGNNRIIEVNSVKAIVWSFPGTNIDDNAQLNSPNSAELLANGHILIADENNNRVIEVDRADNVLKTYTAGDTLGAVAFASRLPNGHTLITDAGNSRAVEVTTNDVVFWQYYTDTDPNSVAAPAPTRALRLAGGNTIISDQFNNRVIVVNAKGKIVSSYGLPLAGGDVIGNNVGYDLKTVQKGLYSPYDAKVVGDFTGITPLFMFRF